MSQEVLRLNFQVTGEDNELARLTLWGSEGCVDMVTCPLGEIEVYTALEKFSEYTYQTRQDTGEMGIAQFVWVELLNQLDELEWQRLDDHSTLIDMEQW